MATFEWDEKKAKINSIKHGIDFADVVYFEFATAAYEFEQVGIEERTIATGFLGNKICVLVFAEHVETIRIISLRKATKHERAEFEKG